MDFVKRHVAFSFINRHVGVGRDSALRSGTPGRPIQGKLGRLRTLLRHTDWRRYDLLRNEEAIQRSAALLGFLTERGGDHGEGSSHTDLA